MMTVTMIITMRVNDDDNDDDNDGPSQIVAPSMTPTTPTPGNAIAGIVPNTTAEDLINNMSLDGTTLHNLEILTNNVDYKVQGSLWSKINFTKTPHGSRLLRTWLLRPLFRKADIDRRADAVAELKSGAANTDTHHR